MNSNPEGPSNEDLIQGIAAKKAAIAELKRRRKEIDVELEMRKREKRELKEELNTNIFRARIKQEIVQNEPNGLDALKDQTPIAGQLGLEAEDEEEDFTNMLLEEIEDIPQIQEKEPSTPRKQVAIVEEDEDEIVDIGDYGHYNDASGELPFQDDERGEEPTLQGIGEENGGQNQLQPPANPAKKPRRRKAFSLSLSRKRPRASVTSSSASPQDPAAASAPWNPSPSRCNFFQPESIYTSVYLSTAEWVQWDARVVGNWTMGYVKTGSNIIVAADRYDSKFDLQIPDMIRDVRPPGYELSAYGYWMFLLTADPEIVQRKEGTFPGDPTTDPGSAPDKILFTGRYYYNDGHNLTAPLKLDNTVYYLSYEAKQVVWNFSDLRTNKIIKQIAPEYMLAIKEEIEKMKKQKIERKQRKQKSAK